MRIEQFLEARLEFSKAVVDAGLVLVDRVQQRCVLNVACIRQDPELVVHLGIKFGSVLIEQVE